MKRVFLSVFSSFMLIISSLCQQKEDTGSAILFHGIVMDASTFLPVTNAQIFINNSFSYASGFDGKFEFYVNKKDSVLFRHLGYKPTSWFVPDSLKGSEFNAGIYMRSDTVSIGEVIIIPRFTNIKSLIMNTPSRIPPTMDNARYNIAISSYQGRISQGKLGDPASNYGILRQQQNIEAYEKGGIPSDMISGINPFMLLPAAYLLIHGLPEKPPAFNRNLTNEEVEEINQKYLESIRLQKPVK